MLKKIYTHVLWRFDYTLHITLPQLFLSLFLPRKVMSGPFKGMNYLNTSVGSVFLPKIIGTYEDELHSVLNDIKNNNYKCFIDIGAAEGYYAVGAKKYLFPSIKKVIAFEATPDGRKLIEKLSYLNGITDIEIEGFCDVQSLSNKMMNEKIFILVDIEGGEYNLLNPEKINFENCDILVEIHDINGLDVELELKRRFISTHDIFTIKQSEKTLPSSIIFHSIIKMNSQYAVNEFRSTPQSWLFIKRKITNS